MNTPDMIPIDMTAHRGGKGRPVVIFIHGLGMDKNFWLDPRRTRLFAKNIPMSVFMAVRPEPSLSVRKGGITFGDPPRDQGTLWDTLKTKGYNVICWSQRRPVGPISAAVEELGRVMDAAGVLFPKNPVVIIGHSRGGLVARKFTEQKIARIKALITLSTPHKGSSVAKLGRYLEPFSGLLKRTLPEGTHDRVSETVKNITNFLEGRAWKELSPDADFFKDLRDAPRKGIRYISVGGSQPRLLTVYMWRKADGEMLARPLLSIPDSLIRLVPSFLAVDEIVPGRGDGLVTLKSSVLPWASEHHDLMVNHLSVVWDRKTARIILRVLEGL